MATQHVSSSERGPVARMSHGPAKKARPGRSILDSILRWRNAKRRCHATTVRRHVPKPSRADFARCLQTASAKLMLLKLACLAYADDGGSEPTGAHARQQRHRPQWWGWELPRPRRLAASPLASGGKVSAIPACSRSDAGRNAGLVSSEKNYESEIHMVP